MRSILLSLLLTPYLLSASALEFSFTIGEVAYIQWLENPYDKVSFKEAEDVAEFPLYMNVLTHEANVQEIYLGVLCNSLDGYNIQIQAADAADKSSAEALADNGTTVRYSMALKAMQNTFTPGALTETKLDLTGKTSSIITDYNAPEDLALNTYEANVYRLEARLEPDVTKRAPELIDFYVGNITATVFLN